jgi:hypothetical protein
MRAAAAIEGKFPYPWHMLDAAHTVKSNGMQ